jgi:hypothetical protein
MKEKEDIMEPHLIKGQTALAKKLGVTQQTISLWQNQGKFRDCFTRIGKKYIYNLDAILEKFAG